jgi:hypothetical protein
VTADEMSVWFAYHSDMSGVVPFATEIDALRYANQWSMQVKRVSYGDADWRNREEGAPPRAGGWLDCTCGHNASRHGHWRLECAAVNCACRQFNRAR